MSSDTKAWCYFAVYRGWNPTQLYKRIIISHYKDSYQLAKKVIMVTKVFGQRSWFREQHCQIQWSNRRIFSQPNLQCWLACYFMRLWICFTYCSVDGWVVWNSRGCFPLPVTNGRPPAFQTPIYSDFGPFGDLTEDRLRIPLRKMIL